MKNYYRGKRILIIGGTGSVGSQLVDRLLHAEPSVIRIFSRDESKQHRMRMALGDRPVLRYLIGDIRDRKRIHRAMENIDIVFHCAAMKHVHSCEYNPFEAVHTNVIGTQHVIEAALDHDVERVIFTSTDKAVNPSNVMGASKLVAERLITAANNMRGSRRAIFASVRFGNVLFSSGSVIPVFQEQILAGGPIKITDARMTRFFMGQRRAVDLVLLASQLCRGGEVFVPKMKALRIIDLAKAMIENAGRGDIEVKEIGVQPGEKIHEELITSEEQFRTIELEHLYVVLPAISEFLLDGWGEYPEQKPDYGPGLYSSADQPLLSQEQIRQLLRQEASATVEELA